MIDNTRLVVLPYLQRWTGSALSIRFLLIPRDSPLEKLVRSDPKPNAPSFATANLKFDVTIVPNPLGLPTIGGGTTVTTLSFDALPSSGQIFNGLQERYPIDPNPPGAKREDASSMLNVVWKHLPVSYQDAVGYTPGGRSDGMVFTDNRYSCTLKTVEQPTRYVPLPPANPFIAWGRLIAAILRTSKLAEAAGMIRQPDSDIEVPAGMLEKGGYVFLTLATGSDASGLQAAGGLKTYAARIPILKTGAPRDLFTPALFPVVAPLATPPTGDYDSIFAEVEDYDDGWAKAVHCAQPQWLNPTQDKLDPAKPPDTTRPLKEHGIRIGWDDEQVTIWMNRQMNPARENIDLDVPTGVQGYRIDVRPAPTSDFSPPRPWASLVRAQGSFAINGTTFGTFNGELGVEVHPTQVTANRSAEFWLPMYFTAWTGPSLVTPDIERMQLCNLPTPHLKDKPEVKGESAVKGMKPAVELLYGTTYEFRVRLMDHTGGGPGVDGQPTNPGPSLTYTIPFRRWIRPLAPDFVGKAPAFDDLAEMAPATIELKRPLLHYPAVMCTEYYRTRNPLDMLLADLAIAGKDREVGLPDPDVMWVEILVEVETLVQDTLATDGKFMELYTTTRAFPRDPTQSLVVELDYREDIPDVLDTDKFHPQATAGPVVLPTARTVRLHISSLCKEDNTDPSKLYFGNPDVRRSHTTLASFRKNSNTETAFFKLDKESEAFNAYFLQPDPAPTSNLLSAQQMLGKPNESGANIASRLAAAIGLRNTGMTLHSVTGERVIFACSSAFRHTLGPDGGSLSFASQSDLALHWIMVIKLTINRDWSWDGLPYGGIVVNRDGGGEVVRFSPSRSLNSEALAGPIINRGYTKLFIFDAIDPKPVGDANPQQLDLAYTLTYSFIGTPNTTENAPRHYSITLPVTTRPRQTPRVTSAGIAMSPYERNPTYSSTAIRKKALWIELAEPLQDDRDRYFARVLSYGPDPLLCEPGRFAPETPESSLPIDDESVRRIIVGQQDDGAGRGAMQPLIPSDSPLHWSLPLPPGLDESSPELFGFFTYELRVGHFDENLWSTAQGRFGAPLRVAGVQHPAPPLICTASWSAKGISVSAPFAVPVLDGVTQFPRYEPPRSSMWVMLYAQAERIDGAERQNVLLLQAPAPSMQGDGKVWTHYGVARFKREDVFSVLLGLGFLTTASLSVLAVEMLPQADGVERPLESGTGRQRILRTSPLTPVRPLC
ncbi:hypothetical protein FGG08_004415 [Glutinoglossum americanum]|uniref:Uncharacterized protein n=1 Tax=Glutinoglossum americanum TaxID=1670608 RepID=A0A9P8I0N5_9PEZI|nr:hypothetical protein FGG08_004415 [Glutinoglossum americanum]